MSNFTGGAYSIDVSFPRKLKATIALSPGEWLKSDAVTLRRQINRWLDNFDEAFDEEQIGPSETGPMLPPT